MNRVQRSLVVAGYAAALLLSAALLYARHLQYTMHAADVEASGGMWAFGDLLLELFIAALFLIPTLLLAFFIRNCEKPYTKYAQTLLGIAITAPICIAALFLPAVGQSGSGVGSILGWLSLGRISASPVFLVALVCSRLLARFRRAKRLLIYGLMVETGTYVLLLAAVLLPWHRR